MDTQPSIKIEMFYYLLIFIVFLNKMTRKSKYSILLNTAIQRPPQEILNFGATLNLGREIEQLSERGDQKLQNHISLEFVKEYLVVQIWQNMFNELNIPYFCTPLYVHFSDIYAKIKFASYELAGTSKFRIFWQVRL